MDPIRNRIKTLTALLGELRYCHRQAVNGIKICNGDYTFHESIDFSAVHQGEWRAFGRDETWGGHDRHYWFQAQVCPEKVMSGQEIRVILKTGDWDLWNTNNPQIMAYVEGKLAGTLDMNHQELILVEEKESRDIAWSQTYPLLFYAYSNHDGKTNFFHLEVAVYRNDVAALYYDLKVPFEAADLLAEEDLKRIETFKVLNDCLSHLDLRKPGSEEFYESVREAERFIQERYYKRLTGDPVTVHSIGHTHIDVAWKWPLKQTRQKAVRSFHTVLRLMERYPEYKFMSSQPQLYEFVKEAAPELFEQIKNRIKEGRWEAEGATWLEPDCNLVSGESLIRHILYGKRFFEKELGAGACQVLWLPDVFGYSAALPQIMKKSGLSYFMTTKISWNEYNQFPYDTFRWRGIDGSEVLAHLISTKDFIKEGTKQDSFNTTYNGRQNAVQIKGTWQRYQNKDLSRDVLTCFGYGDGGGGPTEQMLEESRRMEYGVAGCPQVKQTFVKEFFHILEQNMDKRRLPLWSGELYLEFHRGTYTSMAENKRYNRKCEFLCGDMEFYSVLAGVLSEKRGGFWYPAKEIEANWKLLLLNQFHDILPGSSIKEVYEDSAVQYEKILASGRELVRKARENIKNGLLGKGKGRGLLVWNSLSFSRSGLVQLKGEGVQGEGQKLSDGSSLFFVRNITPKGYQLCPEVRQSFEEQGKQEAAGCVIEKCEYDSSGKPLTVRTAFYEMEFGPNGEIARLYDRREKRELLKPGEYGNHLQVFEDRPMEYDAWNIDASYEERVWDFGELLEFSLAENGPLRGGLYVKRKFLDSVLEQYLYVYRHTARIDFKTSIDWHEHQLLLKAAFPLDILSDSADYEIQFGNVRRPTHYNTSWDRARYETCGHKWADLSEEGYGAALLNDCKYGYDIHDSVMRLTLLKSGIFPNPQADQGLHEFTYALYPHRGDFRRGRVIQEAYDLNCPLEAEWLSDIGDGESFSLIKIQEENVFCDTVKKAEEKEGTVFRLYEAYGRRTQAHVSVPWKKGEAFTALECDCMEKELRRINSSCGMLEIELKPYEIKTIILHAPGSGGTTAR